MSAFALLVNPASGRGAAPVAAIALSRALRERGAEVRVAWSPSAEAVAGMVAEAAAAGEVVVSVGGDGMLHHVAGGAAASGALCAVAPAGRGNDFARMLGLPDDPAAVADLLLAGRERAVDLLRVTGADGSTRWVAGSVYAGVDARAALYVDRMKRVPGSLQYPLAAVRALATYRPARVTVEVDGEAREHDAATVVVANSGYYGQGMHVAPGAVLDDGLADVVVVEARSTPALLRSFPTIYDGSHVHRPEVSVRRGVRVRLTATTGVPVGGDGEVVGTLGSAALDVELVPGALRLLA